MHSIAYHFRELEEQVKDLQEICRSSAADRVASEKLMLETASVTSLTSDSGILPIDGVPIKMADLNLDRSPNGVGQSDASTEQPSEMLATLKAMKLISQTEGVPVIYTGENKSVTLTKKY